MQSFKSAFSRDRFSERFAGWRRILHIAWPLIIANSFWNLQVTIDRIFLGQYSTDAMGAAISAVGIFWAPMALVQQTAAYVTVFIAQYYGAKRFEKIGPATWQATYLSIIGGLLFLLFIPVTPALFEWIAHSERMQELEVAYFQSLCYSALPTALVAVASGFFTGLGKTSVIMWINGVGLVLNVIFDYLFIFGNLGFPALGVAGAGYATALANVGAAIFGYSLVFKKVYQKEYATLTGWRIEKDLMRRLIKFGIPSGMQWALEGLAFTVFLIFVGRMANGDAALAASGITLTIMMLGILPALGIAQAVSVLVGQHLGENQPKEAEQASWHGFQVAGMYIALTAVSFLLFPNFYLSWFHNEENAALWGTVSIMVPYLLCFVAAFTIFDCMNLIFSFALKGAGDTRFVTFVALILPWPLMVLPTWYYSTKEFGVYWSWAAASFFIIVQAIIFWRRFEGGKWKNMTVIN